MNLDVNKILNYTYPELVSYIRFSAGLSNPTTGGGLPGIVGGKDNLQLQQNPEEYAKLLLFFKECKSKAYLALGVGQGGSFLLDSLFQIDAKICHAVDNCDYQRNAVGFSDQHISIKNKVEYLKRAKNVEDAQYFNYYTNDFFNLGRTTTYDTIFIDADHRYEGAKKDYENSLKILNPGGVLIFHDIVNTTWGVKDLWEELDSSKKIHEFVYSIHCGIGIYKP